MTRRAALALAAVAALAAALVLVVVVLPSSSPSCTTPRGDTVATAAYAQLDGVDPELTSLDVYASPDAESCPVLLWVHGGSWQAGDKSTRLTRVKADHFTESGWIFVSVNHRLVAEDNDVRWPAFGDDLAAAHRWVTDNIDDFGGDPDRISLIGHSSGAHVVSIVGTNETLLQRQGLDLGDVRCVVSLDSVTQDLTDQPPWEVDIIGLAFPSDEALVDGSPTLQVAGATTPIPDFLIVTRGRRERLDSSARLAAAVNGAGGSAQVVDLTPYDHAQVSTELGIDGEELVTPAVDDFLRGCSQES